MINDEQLEKWFGPPQLSAQQVHQSNLIRVGARRYAQLILSETPPSNGQREAIEKLRDVVKAAIDAIASEGQ